MICIKRKYTQDVQSRSPTKDDILETKNNIVKIGCPISHIVIDGKTYYGKFYYSTGFSNSNQIDHWTLDTNFYTFDHFVNKLKHSLEMHNQNVVMLNDNSNSYYYLKLKYAS